MGAGASVEQFVQREGIRGEDKYAVTTFRRIELQESDLNILYAIYSKIKKKNPYPKMVNPQSICKYFGVANSDFVLKLFDAVDFDGNESIDFKEFTLGLWNFLSLSSDFLAALVFYIYDPLKFHLLDMKELKSLIEAVHGVKLSSFTPTLSAIMKNALMNNEENGINTEAFGIMCIDNPIIIKPIVTLQKQLRKKIVGPDYWKKLEFRRSASIRGNLRDVNYVYIVNEETEVWRKKDFELGIGREYELDEFEIALKKKKEEMKAAKEAADALLEEKKKSQEEKDAELAKKEAEEEEERQIQLLKEKLETHKDYQQNDDEYVAKNRVKMSEVEGRDATNITGVRRNFADFAETIFMTTDGKFIPPSVPLEAVTVFEFPGEEKFIFGIVTDNKKKEEKIAMVNRDLTRRRMKTADFSKINNNYKFVGYSKLSVKTLPDQIKIRANAPLLELCNNESVIPPLVSESAYVPGQWNETMRSLVSRVKGADHLEEVDKLRKSQNQVVEEEPTVENQSDRVKSRVSIMLNKQREGEGNTRQSISQGGKRNTINNAGAGSQGGKRNTINSAGAGSQGGKRNTINNAGAGSQGGKRNTINSAGHGGKSRASVNGGSSRDGSNFPALKLAAGAKLAPIHGVGDP